MTLDRLAVGHRAIVAEVSGNPAVVQRLAALGLFEGEAVEVIGTAPLGDPIELLVGQTRLSVRRSEAAGVQLRTP